MSQTNEKPMSWGMIIVIMLVTGVVTGLLLGGLNSFLKLSGGMVTSGVGAAIGVVGALLIARRSALLSQQKTEN